MPNKNNEENTNPSTALVKHAVLPKAEPYPSDGIAKITDAGVPTWKYLYL